MSAKDLKDLIDRMLVDIVFEYQGVWGSICPFSRQNISVSYGDFEQSFDSLDAAMNTPILNGRTLGECAEQLENIDY